MILFDSSVVIDARDPDSPFHAWAKNQIAAAVQEGGEGGAVNTIVISEASVRAKNRDTVPALLEGLGLNSDWRPRQSRRNEVGHSRPGSRQDLLS